MFITARRKAGLFNRGPPQGRRFSAGQEGWLTDRLTGLAEQLEDARALARLHKNRHDLLIIGATFLLRVALWRRPKEEVHYSDFGSRVPAIFSRCCSTSVVVVVAALFRESQEHRREFVNSRGLAICRGTSLK